jgi:hypothetical protein
MEEQRNRLLPALVILLIIIIAIPVYQLSKPDEDDDHTETIDEEEIIPELYDYGAGGEEEKNIEIFAGSERINEHTITSEPNDPNHLVAGANDYNSGTSGYAWVGYYSSEDGGGTWDNDYIPGYPGDTRPSVLSGYYGAGDPVLASSASDNMVYMAGIGIFRPGPAASSIWVARSSDGGATFDPEDVFLVAEGYGIERFHDKEWIAVDQESGIIYVSWTTFVAGAQTAHIVVSFSRDQGVTWSPYVIVSEVLYQEWGPQGSQIIVDSEGDVHIAWIDYTDSELRMAHSYNQGLSFTGHETICDVEYVWEISNAAYRTPTMASMAIDRSGGDNHDRLFITWHDNRTGNTDALMVYGDEGGTAWSEIIRVNNDNTTAAQFYPAVAVSPEGYVHVFFYDRRLDINDTALDVFYALSTDGGENFTVNIRATTISTDPGGEEFIGDYNGAWATENETYGVWCDLRTEGNSGDLWFAKFTWDSEDDLAD